MAYGRGRKGQGSHIPLLLLNSIVILSIPMNRIEQAVSCFDQGFSCSQAILATYSTEFGIDYITSLKLAEGFGGGIAGKGHICGAVSGAIMVLGLKYGRTNASDRESKTKTNNLIREFIKRFELRNGSIQCRDIIGCEIDTPEKREVAREKGIFSTVCRKVVQDSAEILEELI